MIPDCLQGCLDAAVASPTTQTFLIDGSSHQLFLFDLFVLDQVSAQSPADDFGHL